MEHLSESFGRLSTSAREWTPQSQKQSQQPQQSHQPHQQHPQPQQSQLQPHMQNNRSMTAPTDWQSSESELNAASVKEFVPGRGWTTNSSMSQGPNAAGGDGLYATFPHTQHTHHFEQPHTGSSTQQEQPAQPTAPSVHPAGPSPPAPFRSLHSMGMTDDLWRFHRDASLEVLRQMDPADPRHKAIPLPYCNAFCLDDTNSNPSPRSSRFGYPSQTFQVTSRKDGNVYCLRRFDGVKSVNPKIAAAVVDQWATLEATAGLVTLHHCFVAQRAVFFVHHYIAGATRLYDRLMLGSGGAGMVVLTESILWSAICQLVATIRKVHMHHLAIRILDSRHVLVQMDATMKFICYINGCGVADALEWESRKSLDVLQMEDVRQLGRLILSMAAGTEITVNTDTNTLANCERYCLQTYSRELHNLAMTLIRSPTPPSIIDVSRALVGRLWDELDHTQLSMQRTEHALASEYESGRALRLLLKLGFVNERPEFGPNRRWAQSGDCYVLTLFRDYVFHQADGAGNPVMDLGHVVTALNKLDAADEEKIVLSSRDGKSLMVVSYADVARCLDSAYHELCVGSVPPASVHAPVPPQPY